jgi:hypothetical protein
LSSKKCIKNNFQFFLFWFFPSWRLSAKNKSEKFFLSASKTTATLIIAVTLNIAPTVGKIGIRKSNPWSGGFIYGVVDATVLQAVVGKVTVIKLLRYVTSCFFK